MSDTNSLHQLWSDFLEAWPPERVREMTLEEYTNPNQDDAFIYWIEFRLRELGSIKGGAAFKFGIYHRADTEHKASTNTHVFGETYAWWKKLGSTPEVAFAAVRSRLVEVIDAAMEGNFARVEDIDLSPTLKWKVAFLYQDRANPGIIPIYRKDALFFNYRAVDPTAKLSSTPHHIMYTTLAERHRDLGDVFEISEELWRRYETSSDRVPTAWAVPLAWILDESAINGLCSQRNVAAEDVDPFLDNLFASAELSEGDELALLDNDRVRALAKLSGTGAGEWAWTQVPVDVPSNLVVNPTSEVRELTLKERNDIWTRAGQGEQEKPEQPQAPEGEAKVPEVLETREPCKPQNIILYGPPGTGKTYSTLRRSLELILGPDRLEGLSPSGIVSLFREQQQQGRIEFVTFHQAYGYEEFVEGLRPVLEDDGTGEVKYELHAGAFKRIALRAAAEGLREPAIEPRFDDLWSTLVKQVEHDEERIARSFQGKTYVLRVTKGGSLVTHPCELTDDGSVVSVSEGFQTASRANTKLIWDHRNELGPEPEEINTTKTNELFKKEKGGEGGHHFTAIWIAYREIWNLSRSGAARRRELTSLDARVQDALDRPTQGKVDFEFSSATRQFVLIVDEINRGNVSKILGELITLLEPDKRLGAKAELKLPLAYSPEHRFAVPPNLHMLGTMNTADRSIALMDVALRRRFTFEELMPSAAVIRDVLDAEGTPEPLVDLVADLFETLNARIRFLYDRDHQLGHAYFLGVNSLGDLRQVFVDRVIPLLQEYFYGAWDKICMVLGCPGDEAGRAQRGAPVAENGVYLAPIVRVTPFEEAATLGFDHDEYEDRLDYQVRPGFARGTLAGDELLLTFANVLNLDPAAQRDRVDALQKALVSGLTEAGE